MITITSSVPAPMYMSSPSSFLSRATRARSTAAATIATIAQMTRRDATEQHERRPGATASHH